MDLFITLPPDMTVGPLDCLYKEVYFRNFEYCPFNCTVVAERGKVGPLNIRLPTPVGLMLSLQLTVLSRSVNDT